MTATIETTTWGSLVPALRPVSPAVRMRVRLAEARRTGFVGLWILAVGAMLIAFGSVWYLGADPDDHPQFGAYLAALGFAVWILLGAEIYRRGARCIELMQRGTLHQGRVTQVREAGLWGPYSSYAAKWHEFVETSRMAGETWALARTLEHSRRVPCTVRIADRSGVHHDIQVHLDLVHLLSKKDEELYVDVLCNPIWKPFGIAFRQLSAEATISPEGQWTVTRSATALNICAAFLRTAVPVVGTYLAASLGVLLSDRGMPVEWTLDVSPLTGAGLVLLLTLSHVLLPVFLLRYCVDFITKVAQTKYATQGRLFQVILPCFRHFIGLFMGVWFAAPIVVLAWVTGWFTLAWAAVHLVLAEHGNRTWRFVEYGSTSLALLLFVASFSVDRLFPLGIIVVVFQGMLLTLLDLGIRDRWVAEVDRL